MPPSCSVCGKSEGVTIQQCSQCRNRKYCSRECQTKDWPTHKKDCNKPWYDKYRKCQDKSLHHGKLELITWSNAKEGTGWGHVFEDEAADLKRKFEVELQRDEAKFYKEWPQGFRWTCCGTDGGMDYGCDHHGSGPKPCTCDFCRMGKPLPDKIYNEDSASRHGLQLRRGPDPRSYNSRIAAIATKGRGMLGLDM
ncbi:hypothetical protein CPC08DRAFT_665197 [Agrocybe pediades]|nr:hypothetical protein CPC08DRAFT_665197 [Agrocybe pediades]